MKATTIFLPAAFAGLAAAAIGGETHYNCETSDASPYLHNVNEMIDNLMDSGEIVCNVGTNGCGETITAYSGEGGAAFMVCGGALRCSGNPNGPGCVGVGCGGVLARIAASYLERLRDECQGPDSEGDIRVGGIISFPNEDSDADEIKLFSKPG